MKRITLLLTIFAVATFAATAQQSYDLAPRGVEPARPRFIPTHRMADAISGNYSASRFVAELAKPTVNNDSYTTSFFLPVHWLNRQIILRVAYASSAFTVTVNGHEVGFAPSGVMGTEFNITKATKDDDNEVVIKLNRDSEANKLYPKSEAVVEGIEIYTQPTIRMRDVVSKVTINEQGSPLAEVAVPIKCDALNRKECRVHYALRLNDTILLAEGYRDFALDMRREDTLRFACVVPPTALWNHKSPTRVRLDLESRVEGRIIECLSRTFGLRQLTLEEGILHVNKEIVALNLIDIEKVKNLAKVAKNGYNGVVVTLDRGAYDVIEECEKLGLFVVVRTPINTTQLGDHIRRGGNPSNDLVWSESYLWRNMHVLHSLKGSAAVVGFEIAQGATSGINIYDTYIMMKSLAPHHLILYRGAEGEWATDKY